MQEIKDFSKDLMAGGVSGIIAKTVAAPIERIKLLLQTQIVNSQMKGKMYNGPIDCMKRVYAEQGLFSFWRGNVANVLRYFPSQAMNFAFKDVYKKFLSPKKDDHYSKVLLLNLISGGAAGVSSLTVTYPLDMARTRLAADVGNGTTTNRLYTNTFGCLKAIFLQNGIRGIYSGYFAALGGVAVFRSLYLGGYDTLKIYLLLEKQSLFVKYIAAQALTTIVGTMCYPLDTIRRRLMMQPLDSFGQPVYKNGIDCVIKIYQREGGIKGYFPGLGVNIVRGISGAILLVGYDELKVLFKKL